MVIRVRGFVLRKQVLAALLLPFLVVASSGARGAGDRGPNPVGFAGSGKAVDAGAPGIADQSGQAGAMCAPCSARPKVYSVITLGGDEYWGGYLNEKGQVAAYGGLRNRFFDGNRWYDLGSLGGGYTLIQGLNNRGVVVGDSLDASEPFGNVLGFYWTAAGGMRALPGVSVASATAINDRNQIVGWTGASGVSDRAIRWDPRGRTVDLGPLPFSLSEALAINNRGESGGFMDVAPGPIHATKWTATGALIDLGSLDNNGFASTRFLNERGDAAGETANDVFFLSQRSGMVAIGARATQGIGHVIGLTDRGEIVGNTEIEGGEVAYLWSRERGLVLLPPGDGPDTYVGGMNRHNDLVGSLEKVPGDRRAVRWHGLTAPIDLNAHLHRPPPGLELIAGTAINDKGDIVAYSNAGLVLLRPGTTGTDAPVLGPVVGLAPIVHVGDDLEFTLGFVDNSTTQTHTVSISWDDGCDDNAPPPTLHETGGAGEIKFRHRFCRVGSAGVWIHVSDSGGQSTELLRQTYVDDPSTLTLNGKGMLPHARAGRAARPLYFALWIPLAGMPSAISGAARSAKPFLRLGGPLRFESDQVQMPVRGGQLVHVEGTGNLNGRPGYRFSLDVPDDTAHPATSAQLRVRVSHTDSGTEIVDYDNIATGKVAKLTGGWVKLSR